MSAPNDEAAPDHLPRLAAGAYQGRAIVHWTLTLQNRGRGWLTDSFHQSFRWLLLHGCARYQMACPVYCLMPDHAHLLIMGWTPDSDQRLFLPWLRKHSNRLLKTSGHIWQKQAYDHVLRPDESDRYAFETLAKYIRENPVRANLVREPQDWKYTQSVVPGYPELHLWAEDYWLRYWRIFAAA